MLKVTGPLMGDSISLSFIRQQLKDASKKVNVVFVQEDKGIKTAPEFWGSQSNGEGLHS